MSRALAAAIFVAAILSSMPLHAADVTLIVHHFLPPTANAHSKMIVPWVERVQQQSQGRIRIEVYPAMSLGGKPPELYSQVRDGAADFVWTLLGYTRGVFPRSEVFELPLVHAGSARASTVAANASFDMLAEDFKDVKIIFLHTHDGNVIHSATKAVESFDDVKGMKLRAPGRIGVWMLESWGAEPVGMPVPALPQAMAKGVVDGALTTYEIVPALKLQELDKHVTELPDGDRFGTAIFMFAMNKERYASLPADLKKVIDDNSGTKIADEIGTLWESFEQGGVDALVKAKVQTHVLSAAEAKRFNSASEVVIDRWIEEMKGKGIDGAALVKKARAAIAAATN
jgi:TRAP-type C4-dicarboxylate transport system substrate-binding protein